MESGDAEQPFTNGYPDPSLLRSITLRRIFNLHMEYSRHIARNNFQHARKLRIELEGLEREIAHY